MNRSYNKNRSLDNACANGDLTEIDKLISKGYDPNYVNPEGHTCVEYLCQKNNGVNYFPILQYLLNKGLILTTPIQEKLYRRAIYRYDHATIKLLLNQGYQPDIQLTVNCLTNCRAIPHDQTPVISILLIYFGLDLLYTKSSYIEDKPHPLFYDDWELPEQYTVDQLLPRYTKKHLIKDWFNTTDPFKLKVNLC